MSAIVQDNTPDWDKRPVQPECPWMSGNIFIRPNLLPRKGCKVEGHRHNFDHTTIVFKGSVHVKAVDPDGTIREKDFDSRDDKNRHFLVLKDTEHEITALEDDTEFWCVYSHRDSQGEVVQEFTGWFHANLQKR